MEALADPNCGWFYRRDADSFRQIPGSPIAYWASEKLGDLFIQEKRSDRFFEVGSGLSTGDNERFLRYIWEVSRCSVALEARSQRKWYLFYKGGEFRKWFGNLEYVVNWENDGQEIKHWVTHNPKDPNTTSWSRRIFNTHLYFQEGISWSVISSGAISFRLIETKGMISNAAGGVFDLGSSSPKTIKVLLAAFNTEIWRSIFSLLNPTMNYSSGVIAKAPCCIQAISSSANSIVSLSEACVSLSRVDWDSFETSWDFKRNPLV